MKDTQTWVGLVEGARVVGVSPHTLRAWTRERRVPFYRVGMKLMFEVEELVRVKALRVPVRVEEAS